MTTLNQKLVRAVYPKVDWDEYDREVVRATVEGIRERFAAEPLPSGYEPVLDWVNAIHDGSPRGVTPALDIPRLGMAMERITGTDWDPDDVRHIAAEYARLGSPEDSDGS